MAQTAAQRRQAQRATAKALAEGRSPLGGEFRSIVQRASARGPTFRDLNKAVDYAKSLGKHSYIVARGNPREQFKYGKNRWLAINSFSDPNFYEWSRRGIHQRQEELFTGDPTIYRVIEGK